MTISVSFFSTFGHRASIPESLPLTVCHTSWAQPSWQCSRRLCLAIPQLRQSLLLSSESRPLQVAFPGFLRIPDSSFHDLFKLVLCAVKRESLSCSSLFALFKSMVLLPIMHVFLLCLRDRGADFGVSLNFLLAVVQQRAGTRGRGPNALTAEREGGKCGFPSCTPPLLLSFTPRCVLALLQLCQCIH